MECGDWTPFSLSLGCILYSFGCISVGELALSSFPTHIDLQSDDESSHSKERRNLMAPQFHYAVEVRPDLPAILESVTASNLE